MMKILSTRTSHLKRPRSPLRHAARATSPAAAGEAFGLRHSASPRPRRGKCRATRGDRGARCSYAFLTIKTDIVQGAPSVTLRVTPPPLRQGRLLVYGMQLPLSEAGERSTSSNHTSPFGLVLGRFSHTTCYPLSCALRACFSDRSVSAEQREAIGALVAHTHFSR